MLRLKRSAVIALALLLTGCQLRVGLDVAVDREGAGVVELALALDEELVEILTESGFDPTLGIDELVSAAPEWEVERLDTVDGVTLSLEAAFDSPAHFSRLLRDFQSGGDSGDASLFDGLEIDVGEDGAIRFSGRAGLLLPSTAGAEGAGVTFDRDDLEELLEERGHEFVRYDLRVSLPAEPVVHDGDDRDGNSVTWRLPVGELRDVEARSAPVPDRTLVTALAAGILALAVGATLGWWYRRRRRSRSRGR